MWRQTMRSGSNLPRGEALDEGEAQEVGRERERGRARGVGGTVPCSGLQRVAVQTCER